MKCPDDGCDCMRSDCLISGCVRCKAPASEVAPLPWCEACDAYHAVDSACPAMLSALEGTGRAFPTLPELPSLPSFTFPSAAEIAASVARNEHALLIEVAPYALRGLDMAIASLAVQDSKLDTAELEALKAKLQHWLGYGNVQIVRPL